MRIIVTGGIGSGKSSVLKILKSALVDYDFLSVDNIVLDLYKNPKIIKNLISKFGTADKKKLSDIGFADPANLKQQEDILSSDAYIVLLKNMQNKKNIIVEVPLYFEKINEYPLLDIDLVLTVYSDNEHRLKRIKERNNFSDEKIKSIFKIQLPQEDTIKNSNFIIQNNTNSFSDLEKEVSLFLKEYKLQKK